MADLVLEGPLGNHFLCKVPANTTIGVTQDEDLICEQPFGSESRELAASENSRYLFLKMKGEFGAWLTVQPLLCNPVSFQVKLSKAIKSNSRLTGRRLH